MPPDVQDVSKALVDESLEFVVGVAVLTLGQFLGVPDGSQVC